ncbi:UPF0587 protein CG4646 [Neocloeon triangulifer]|uniref:UPF0587 protein CG4646 n=1 Tax=Neocloeon triangulifer TaxID=2078957 RepID=UPI00286F8B71|nr:UPF0587 protein CG4646 [Neocloeon triangulifer]
MRLGLQISCELEQVKTLRPKSDGSFNWCLKVKCGSCGTEDPTWHQVSESDADQYSDVQGDVNFHMKCKFCKRPGFIDVVKGSSKEYTEDDSGKFKTIVSFTCKGIEPFQFAFEGGWEVKCLDSNTTFEDVDLSDDWVEFDGKSQLPVGISETKSQFVREPENKK